MNINNVQPKQTFWLKGGKGIKNIVELGRELRTINEETFKHHVNEDKNDFASWIEECVRDTQLAALVKTTKNSERMSSIIERRIQQLTTPKPKKQPKIIITGNTTTLSLSHKQKIIKTKKVTPIHVKQERKIIKTDKVTPLKLNHKHEIIHTGNTTPLNLNEKTEIYVHEPKNHHKAIHTLNYLILGAVLGGALIIISLALL